MSCIYDNIIVLVVLVVERRQESLSHRPRNKNKTLIKLIHHPSEEMMSSLRRFWNYMLKLSNDTKYGFLVHPFLWFTNGPTR